jgi:Ca-activated chloride channel homolog
MPSTNHDPRLRARQDRRLIRTRWHSKRFVVAQVTAPQAVSSTERAPVNLAFVIDRSGSMANGRLQLAMNAVEEGIARLKPSDRFSVVVYDDHIDSLVSGAFATAEATRGAIERLRHVGARGATDLGGGWLRGCEHVASELLELGVNRVLLLTDGLANRGMTSLEELEHHAAELRKRGVSTSTFGVGDSFNEVLLQAMAQAGGGQFYDIASAAQIRDHIESEVGETLEVVAHDVRLDVTFPDSVRVEPLGAFQARIGPGRAIVELADLVSGQQVDVPLRLSFPFGEMGDAVMMELGLADREGVFSGAGDRLAWGYADDRDNDEQARDREVDRLIAGIYAARARRAAVSLNRGGDFDGARDALQATARKIRGYAGDDVVLQGIVEALMQESEQFHRVMAERARKEHYARSSHAMRSRDAQGKALRQME